MKLLGTSTIVTGGASGLGAATATRLAAAGARVTILDLNEEKGRETAARIGGLFSRVDTTSVEDVERGLDDAQRAYGVARVLVACAGGGAGSGRTVSKGRPFPLETFRKTIEMNVIGTFNCASRFAARLSEVPIDSDEERGVIICTASVAAFEGQIGQIGYATAKGGIASMTLVLARDLADLGIRANTIAPGPFGTEVLKRVQPNVLASLEAQQLFPKRLGRPEEFAHLVQSVVENPMINGTVIRIDSGTRFAPR